MDRITSVEDSAKPTLDKDSNSIPLGNEDEIVARMAKHMAAMMTEMNLDLTDPNFQETPQRVAKMYMEMFHGLREGSQPKITTFPNEEGYHHMVIEREIPFYSMCAHHFVPFYGHAHIAYIPEAEVVGMWFSSGVATREAEMAQTGPAPTISVPAGTRLVVRMSDTVDSRNHRAGHRFRGQLKWAADVAALIDRFANQLDWPAFWARRLVGLLLLIFPGAGFSLSMCP